MKKSDLTFEFPQELVALSPQRPSRVLFNELGKAPVEISLKDLLGKFNRGDILVLNETKVIPSRLLAKSGEEFLFVKPLTDNRWEVLFPAKTSKVGQKFLFPGDLEVELISKGLPQVVRTSKDIDFDFFDQYGQVNLPPYILSERGTERFNEKDREWYQTVWAKEVGSVAAPTASLHFSLSDLRALQEKGVRIEKLTLHVGLGTFFPLRTEELKDHHMHGEQVSVSKDLIEKAYAAKEKGQRVWALGTTVMRALESAASGLLELNEQGVYRGESRLFIYPPYDFKVANGLLTNFHQPESTLLALVCAFFGTNFVKEAYVYAIEKRFRLFSYGDLSAWIR